MISMENDKTAIDIHDIGYSITSFSLSSPPICTTLVII